ncbi:putative sister chromatid cohesion protein [Podospora didyma]|uniref:Sister chromatid cohesion protein n=1 Tax=Podospora didyma TaxID=330526 RepID=A0AAE0P4N2_9PEZI|nr:putative sister chromatid cohesion protein [Podospora didyma]
MFYSHEILTSRQYGVATVWLVSTIGLRSTNRKITRKAIQEVDVEKACETILQPGAPIALRLQGSLLYGVSRVYSQQCSYVLTDAEKVQNHMRAFYSTLGGSENALDPQAGKTKRDHLILLDDPDFDLNIPLPAFNFDSDGNLVDFKESQASRKTTSQLSPMQPGNSSSGSFKGAFDLIRSPSAPGNSQLQSPFGVGSSSVQLRKDGEDELMFFQDEEQLQVFDDWGLEIDADGNMMPIVPEPELPQLPLPADASQQKGLGHANPVLDAQGDVVMSFGDDLDALILPADAEPFPPRQPGEGQQQIAENEFNLASDQVVEEPARKRRARRRALLAPDAVTKHSRQELKSWNTDYLEIVENERARRRRNGVTAAEARNNAFALVFGRGIADIGLPTGIPGYRHPLAISFAGNDLRAQLFGIPIDDDDEEETEAPRGRRRTAIEALELEDENAERRVRPRLSSEANQQQAGQVVPVAILGSDGLLIFGDDEVMPEVEVGRAAGSGLPDLPSDVPWNRGSSQIPSSSVKGSKQHIGSGRRVSASPLHGRGSQLSLPEIERYSDQPAFGSDGLGSMQHSGDLTFSNPPAVMRPGSQEHEQQEQNTSQALNKALDREGQNFLGFLKTSAREKGEEDENDSSRRWVAFDDLFEPTDKSRAVVAKAFYHILQLATKNFIKVEQEGMDGVVPFGEIRVGVNVMAQGGDDVEF